jgi:hypothetical protein
VTNFDVEIEGSAVGTPHRDKLMFWCVSQAVWTFVLYCMCLFDELLAASMFSLFRDALIQHSRFEFTFFTPGLFSAVYGVCISPLSFLLAALCSGLVDFRPVSLLCMNPCMSVVIRISSGKKAAKLIYLTPRYLLHTLNKVLPLRPMLPLPLLLSRLLKLLIPSPAPVMVLLL